ncbi:MAG: hypothetical protein QN141_02260 [Armatimonadota bacterium]|nr:hypothetical protein [Armatimonadota bacterium]MDR7450724.1 hypothetical protein [Armatimonadota bacterium]MDR7466080.1 hypothetical protein [Armatimonadota bacterium]MDR7493883.1 hypothetical protein [Armatimonadota bacterium]MDR7498956.1 hypothetical protein [Armatimonadota bacterium]
MASQILAAGPDALPALLAALQASGIAVRGPGGVLAVQPPDQGQGLAVSAWEARFMASLVGKDRTLLVPLTALQDVLVRAAPELQGEPIARHILDGIRAHAQGPDGPMRVWARLIVELGRQRQTGGAQDLLGQVSPAEVRLDAVQLSLIAVRLIGDLEALKERASTPGGDIAADSDGRASRRADLVRRRAGPGGWFTPGRVYAAEPCREESPVISREQVSASGFDALKGVLREKLRGVLRGGPVGERVHKQVRDYNTLVLVLAALRIEVAMDPPGPPLFRTKTTEPGEQRFITARVYLDPKSEALGMKDCINALLARLGLKLNVGDPRSGSIAGVPLTWRLTAGDDVLLVEAGVGQTDQDGSEAFAVLGKPQARNLDADAKRVSKQAAVAVRFDLRPYALLGTTPGPGGPLTAPEVLLDLTYGYEVTYPFEVVDWEGGGGWIGTVTYTETRHAQTSVGGPDSHYETESTSTLRLVAEAGETTMQDITIDDRTFVTVVATVRGEYSRQFRSRGRHRTYCGANAGGWRTLNSVMDETVSGSGSAPGYIRITLTQERATIHAGSEGSFPAPGRKVGRAEGCPRDSTVQQDLQETVRLDIGLIDMIRDPRSPDILRGSRTSTRREGEARITSTMTWDLRRR